METKQTTIISGVFLVLVAVVTGFFTLADSCVESDSSSAKASTSVSQGSGSISVINEEGDITINQNKEKSSDCLEMLQKVAIIQERVKNLEPDLDGRSKNDRNIAFFIDKVSAYENFECEQIFVLKDIINSELDSLNNLIKYR